jgi:hypothetical protein
VNLAVPLCTSIEIFTIYTVPGYWCHNASTASTHQGYPVSRLRSAGSFQ